MVARVLIVVLLIGFTALAAPARGPAAQPAELRNVRLLDGPFKAAAERDAKYLLALGPDRLLSAIRAGAKLEPRAPIYGGWESKGVSGHMLGHYLSACSKMWASTADARFRERVNYIVDELAQCQAQRPDGYVGGITDQDRIWGEVRAGKIESKGFDLNGGWVPWYVVHKIMAGLVDAHRCAGSEKAKAVVTKLADWAIDVTANLDDEKWQKMLACEHGGMNEALADVFAMTGEQKYLSLARQFYHRAVLDPLAKGERQLQGLHANTQIPKIIGAGRIYELTGDEKFHTIAHTFANEVIRHHSYATGGHGLHEHFGERDQLSDRIDVSTGEVCGTYNMIKLSRMLFAQRADSLLADYDERAQLNQILASQDPRTGMLAYFMSLKPGHFLTYSTPTDSFWCCVGTGIENHARYADGIYFHRDDQLYVNQFIASELNWAEQGLTVRLETKFPEEPTVRLTVAAAKQPTEAEIFLRIPPWARKASVQVNGKPSGETVQPGDFYELRRTWSAGDVIELTLPMELHVEPMPDNPQRMAILFGPMVLAADLGSDGIGPPMPYSTEPSGYANVPTAPTPTLVLDDDDITRSIEPVEGRPLTFRTKNIGRPHDVTLIPLYRAHHVRYAVYFDTYTPEQWAEQEKQHAAEQERLRALAARTIDQFQPGAMQPERDHNLLGERTQAGEFQGKKWRDATDGWFSFDMKVDPDQPTELVLSYWGSDVGSRTFDVLVDGQKIATQTLNNNQPGKVFDVTHPLPADLTRGKRSVSVKLQSHPGQMAGGLFGCRTVSGER